MLLLACNSIIGRESRNFREDARARRDETVSETAHSQGCQREVIWSRTVIWARAFFLDKEIYLPYRRAEVLSETPNSAIARKLI